MDSAPDGNTSNIFVLESIAKVVSRVYSVSYAGVSTLDKNDATLIAGYEDAQNSLSQKYLKDVLSAGRFSYNAEGIFFAGVTIPIESKLGWVLWLADTKHQTWDTSSFEGLEELSHLAAYLVKSSHQISGRDATRIIETQRELVIKNRKLAEANARRRAMLENIGDGVVGINSKGEIIYLNPSAEKLTGYKKEELEGSLLVHSLALETEDGEKVSVEERPIRNALYQNKQIETRDYFYVRKDGSKFATAITATPVMIYGQIIGGVNVFRDITTEHEVDRMKTEFISLASHQLKTPLASMKWFGEMLLNGDVGQMSAEQKDLVNTIYESNERLIALVNRLLNISRIESGRFILEPQDTNITELVHDVVKELQPRYEPKKQEIIKIIPESIPTIKVDPKLIRHTYMNLLTNAIKYTPEGGKVTVTLKLEGDNLMSSVRDTGMGIPSHQHEQIFKKFFRADNAAKVETDGTGLGLYLAKQIVEKSGGSIGFESSEGGGSRFWFSLPLSGSKPIEGEVSLDV